MSKNKIRVLVVDDSAVVRQSLSSILGSDSEIEVMGTAADPIIAVKKIMTINKIRDARQGILEGDTMDPIRNKKFNSIPHICA